MLAPPAYQSVLDELTEYWTGQRTGVRHRVVIEPTCRQLFDHIQPNLEEVVDRMAEHLRREMAADEQGILPAVYCDFGTISTAKLYGGTVIPPPDGGMVHIKPRVIEPDELAGLEACAFEASDFQLAVNLYHKVCDRLETGDLFLRTPDFQGPVNTLALVMDQQEMMMGMVTDPEAIHAALDSITDTLIAFHQRLRAELGGGRVIGNIWPYTFLPEPLGIAITQDLMPLLSPDLYREFEIPRLRRIAEAFGGVQIHCCGKYGHQLPVLKESGILIRGLEFHHPFTTFAEIHEVFGDDVVYVPFLFDECRDFEDDAAFIKAQCDQGADRTRFWFARSKNSDSPAS